MFERLEKHRNLTEFTLFQCVTVNLVISFAVLLLLGGAVALMALLLKSQIYEDGKFSSIFIEALQTAQNMLSFKNHVWSRAFFSTFPALVDCGVNPWGAWTICSATCGGGSKNRTRNKRQCIKC